MHESLQPPGWVRPSGYANGIVASGRQVYIAGQVGWNATEKFESSHLADQTEQALKNVIAVLSEASGSPSHIVRMTWYIVDKDDYQDNLVEIGKRYRKLMGKHFPVMSMVQVAALIEDGAKVEIEATAVVP